MKAVLIDDEEAALAELTFYLKKFKVEIIGAFTAPQDGYECILSTSPDVVFLDISMPEISGLEMAVKIRKNLPATSIVFVTANPIYSLEAYQAHPVDYILKPIDENRLRDTLEYIQTISEMNKVVVLPEIKCFGVFTFNNGKEEIGFTTQKSKELFAFMLCNTNVSSSRNYLARTIFNSGDSKNDANNLRVTLHRIKKTLVDANIKKEHLLINENNTIFVAPGICDIVDFLNFVHDNKVIHKGNQSEALRIIDLVRGDLFSDIDSLWISELREYVYLQLEELILKVVWYYILEENKTKEAEFLLLKLIDQNPQSENGYTSLLDICIGAKACIKYKYYYKRYRKLMREEYNTDPERKYVEQYIKCCL